MTRKKTKFCLSWPNNTLKVSGRLQNIAILLTERTIMPYSNLILPLSALFYRMWRHILLDDSDAQKVPGVAECSPPPLIQTYMYFTKENNYLKFVMSKLPIMTTRLTPLRHHGRRIDSVWKLRSYAGALKENPINLYIFWKLNVIVLL